MQEEVVEQEQVVVVGWIQSIVPEIFKAFNGRYDIHKTQLVSFLY